MTVWRGVVFRDYYTPGMDGFEVCVADGVITANDRLPEELDEFQAKAVGLIYLAAARELEGAE